MSNKTLLLSLAASMLIGFGACKKDKKEEEKEEVKKEEGPAAITKTQQSTIFYMSGNWCGPCGLYGVPAKANAKTKYGDKVNILACQLNGSGNTDPLNNADANSLAGVFNVTGVPTAYILANLEGTSVGGGSTMSATMETAIGNNIGVTDVLANMIVDKAKIEGSTISIETRTKFFKAGEGQYRLAAYIIEDNIAGRQYSSGSGWADYDFMGVVRKSLGSTVTGDDFVKDAEANKEYPKTITTSLNTSWNKANLKIVLVLWKATTNSSGGTTVAVVNSISKHIE